MKCAPELDFLVMRVAQQRGMAPPQIADLTEVGRLQNEARAAYRLQQRVIASAEAAGVSVDDGTLEDALLREVDAWGSHEAMDAGLAAFQLDRNGLRFGLARELMFDTIINRVAARVPEATEAEVRSHYDQHPEQFVRPERRRARHLLVTINEEFPDNAPAQALARIQEIAAAIAGGEMGFAEAAARYSECPTALNGGQLGDVPGGTLYAELDRELFAMQVDETRGPILTVMGYHLLRCDGILPGERLAFEAVAGEIRARLTESRRRHAQRRWLKELSPRMV